MPMHPEYKKRYKEAALDAAHENTIRAHIEEATKGLEIEATTWREAADRWACVVKERDAQLDALQRDNIMLSSNNFRLREELAAANKDLDQTNSACATSERQKHSLVVAINRIHTKIESATASHPNAVRFLLDEALEIAGEAISKINTNPLDNV